jgi:hypothetical protein
MSEESGTVEIFAILALICYNNCSIKKRSSVRIFKHIFRRHYKPCHVVIVATSARRISARLFSIDGVKPGWWKGEKKVCFNLLIKIFEMSSYIEGNQCEIH